MTVWCHTYWNQKVIMESNVTPQHNYKWTSWNWVSTSVVSTHTAGKTLPGPAQVQLPVTFVKVRRHDTCTGVRLSTAVWQTNCSQTIHSWQTWRFFDVYNRMDVRKREIWMFCFTGLRSFQIKTELSPCSQRRTCTGESRWVQASPGKSRQVQVSSRLSRQEHSKSISWTQRPPWTLEGSHFTLSCDWQAQAPPTSFYEYYQHIKCRPSHQWKSGAVSNWFHFLISLYLNTDNKSHWINLTREQR